MPACDAKGAGGGAPTKLSATPSPTPGPKRLRENTRSGIGARRRDDIISHGCSEEDARDERRGGRHRERRRRWDTAGLFHEVAQRVERTHLPSPRDQNSKFLCPAAAPARRAARCCWRARRRWRRVPWHRGALSRSTTVLRPRRSLCVTCASSPTAIVESRWTSASRGRARLLPSVVEPLSFWPAQAPGRSPSARGA